jgi:hypothetical protein
MMSISDFIAARYLKVHIGQVYLTTPHEIIEHCGKPTLCVSLHTCVAGTQTVYC